MPAPATHPAPVKLMAKKDVCDYLGKSLRTVAEYMAQGKLPFIYVHARNGKQAMFDPADVARFKKDMDQPIEPRTANPTGIALARNEPVAVAPHIPSSAASLQHFLTGILHAYPIQRPWLDLKSAVEYSGLPASYLLAQARSGSIRAVNIGTGKAEFWRFNREALGK